MKSFRSRETLSVQFEGRTLEDALSRAREEFGAHAQVRCWKVRRGGVLGFFEHESYVAGLQPPAGATVRGRRARALRVPVDDVAPDLTAEPVATEVSSDVATTVETSVEETAPAPSPALVVLATTTDTAASSSGPSGDERADAVLALAHSHAEVMPESLFDLVPGLMPETMSVPAEAAVEVADDVPAWAAFAALADATTDEVTLGADFLSARDFSEVLAQAEAALVAPISDEDMVHVVADDAAPPPALEATSGATVDETAPPSLAHPAPLAPSGDDARAERIEGLRARLAMRGVPEEYLPDESETLDALMRALATLPVATPLSVVPGSLVVVVGARRDALATAQHLQGELRLAPSDLIVAERSGTSRRQVLRRRSSEKMTILVLEAPVGSRGLAEVGEWIEALGPEHVLAAVPATTKRSDVRHWTRQLGRVDALCLSRLRDTYTVAELMGVAPIAYVEGRRSSSLRWVELLVGEMLEEEH